VVFRMEMSPPNATLSKRHPMPPHPDFCGLQSQIAMSVSRLYERLRGTASLSVSSPSAGHLKLQLLRA
jgi:hypothetical protein